MIVLSTSDLISLLGIILNIILVFWITTTIQGRMNNSRLLKDFFMNEIKCLKNDYDVYISGLLNDENLPKNIKSDFNNYDLSFNNLIHHLNSKYSVNLDYFFDFSYELQVLIDNDDCYLTNFKENKKFHFNEETKKKIEGYKSKHFMIFYNLIVQINDYEKKKKITKNTIINFFNFKH
jgi:hypothetical protein